MNALEFEYILHPEGTSAPRRVTVPLSDQQLGSLAEVVAQYITEELYEEEDLEDILSDGEVHEFGFSDEVSDILNVFDDRENVIFRTLAATNPKIADSYNEFSELIEDESIEFSLLSELPNEIWPQVNELLRAFIQEEQ